MKRKTSPHRIIFCFGQFWVSQQLLCQQIFSEVFRFSVNSRSPHSLWDYVRCSGNSRAADNYCSIKCSQWTISTGWFSELIQERFMNPCSIIQTCRQTRKRSPTLPKDFRSKYVFFVEDLSWGRRINLCTNCEENLDHQCIAMYQYGSEYNLFGAFFRTCFYFFLDFCA